MSKPELSYPPGFRFHPTDEELVLHYLRNQITSLPIPVSIIAEVDIYKFNPWELPAKSTFGDREWYFFTPRDRKYPNGIRPNRAAASGYWKATGTDKPIGSNGVNIGVKKALVFYKGKPPKGHKTNWIMHEYRLAESPNCANNNFLMRAMKPRDASMRLDDWVLCRIYQKANNQTTSTQPTIESREVEQSANLMDEAYLSGTSNLSHHNNSGRLPKSSTLSEMFSDGDLSTLSHFLYDNPTETSNNMGYQRFNQQYYLNNHNNGININPRLSGPSPLATTNNLRQKRPMEEDGSALLHQSKKLNTTNINNQCNTVNQAYLNPNLMWNSHMGLN